MGQALSEYEKVITPLITGEQIATKCDALATRIDSDYRDKDLVMIGILKGVFPFYADLVRRVTRLCRNDFLGVSSYGSQVETSGVVRLTADLSESINGRDVLIVDDIVDSGLTMDYVLQNLRARGPRSVKICTLLHKPENERVSVPLEYVGFVIPNHFVIGYGLDYDQRFRNLPYIGYFADEVPALPE